MKKHENKIGSGLIVLLGLCLLLLPLGCSAEKEDQREPVVTKRITAKIPAQKVAAKPSPKEPVAPTKQPSAQPDGVETARLPYDPTGKINPFMPLYQEEPEPPKAEKKRAPKKPERPRTPLERLELGQLRLTAIIFSETRPRAMVEEGSGKGYVIEIGTHIGIERGQVTDITKDRVVIEHSQADDFGKTAIRRRELKLQKPAGD
ncbi:MAG: pilus assembly protein PilP [Desulfobacterales bacterium]|nr:pilus assembly protein PilP [Desulfobacterales bacterium]